MVTAPSFLAAHSPPLQPGVLAPQEPVRPRSGLAEHVKLDVVRVGHNGDSARKLQRTQQCRRQQDGVVAASRGELAAARPELWLERRQEVTAARKGSRSLGPSAPEHRAPLGYELEPGDAIPEVEREDSFFRCRSERQELDVVETRQLIEQVKVPPSRPQSSGNRWCKRDVEDASRTVVHGTA